jgi:hypothetical protein
VIVEPSAAEIWKPVIGYEDSYEVSNQGRVRSLDREVLGKNGSIRKLKGKALKGFRMNNKDNNLGVCIYGDGTKKKVQISHLVWEAFIGELPSAVYHRDCMVKNDCVENLASDKKERVTK